MIKPEWTFMNDNKATAWECVCGALNAMSNNKCGKCGKNKKGSLNYIKLGLVILIVWFLIATITFVITGNALNAFWIIFSGTGATFLIHAMTTNE